MADNTWISEIRHHRHWQHVLEHMCGSKLSALSYKLPEHGTVMGGTMSLQGHNITLACFHGINFRSKSWALFTMDEPYICFATEAADVIDGQSVKHFCHLFAGLLALSLSHSRSGEGGSPPQSVPGSPRGVVGPC